MENKTTFALFVVDSVKGISCTAHADYDDGISGTFFLPPLARSDTSQIKVGSKFYGVFNYQSGIGALIVGIGDADFDGHFDYEIVANGTKLSTHRHEAGTLAAPNGTVTGVTGSPTGV
jgi:hypothetical protein